jgi:hypothetical protein
MTISYAATLTLSKKTSLIFILIFTTIVVFDSTIVAFSSYSGVRLPTWLNIAIFVIFSIIFVASSTMLLNSVRKSMLTDTYKPAPLGLRYFHGIISATLILTVAIILIIIFQMLILNKYSLILLRVQIYLSHLSALVFLSFLVFLFAGWLISKRNYVIMLYTISFSLACVNLMVSLIYLDSYFFISGIPDVKPYPITSYVTSQPGLPFTESLSITFVCLCVMWTATAIFLSQYRHKIKYFTLVAIPLIYYIFPLEGYFGDVFFNLLQSSPVSYSIIYILIFQCHKTSWSCLV